MYPRQHDLRQQWTGMDGAAVQLVLALGWLALGLLNILTAHRLAMGLVGCEFAVAHFLMATETAQRKRVRMKLAMGVVVISGATLWLAPWRY